MKKIVQNKTASFIISMVLTAISAFAMAVGVNIFVSPNGFLSTGATGISLIFGRLYDVIVKPEKSFETTIAGISLFILNIPLLILSWKKLSHRFTILTAINVIVNSVSLTLLPDDLCVRLHLSVAEHNISFLDAAIFAGLMNGTANALAYIVGGSTGGVDILSMFFSLRKQYSIGRITTFFNGFIILIGIAIANNDTAIASAFYTLVFLVICSIVIDLFYVRNKRNILFIISTKGKEVSEEITKKFVRGVTVFDAKGAYTGEHKDFLYCACSSFEVVEIIKKVKEIDNHAFISVVEANKVHGNFMSKELR